jgi:hypothetical protein
MGAAESPTGRFGEKSSAPIGMRIQDRPARSLVTHSDYANPGVRTITEINKDMQANMPRIQRNEGPTPIPQKRTCNTSNIVWKAHKPRPLKEVPWIDPCPISCDTCPSSVLTHNVPYKLQPKPQTSINNGTTTYSKWHPHLAGLILPAPAGWVIQHIPTALLQSYWLSSCVWSVTVNVVCWQQRAFLVEHYFPTNLLQFKYFAVCILRRKLSPK